MIDNVISYALITILSMIILWYFMFKSTRCLFDPMNMFSAYYMLVVPSAFHTLYNNFEKGEYVTHYNANAILLFNLSVLYLIIGFLSSVLGYELFKKKQYAIIRLETERIISNKVIITIIIIYFFAGIANFTVNVYKIAGGNFMAYMSTLSARHAIDKEIPHTTIFYLFTYISVYLMIYFLKRNKINGRMLLPLLTIVFIMLFSTGRGFTTLSYFITVIGIYYLLNFDITDISYNIKYIHFFFYISIGAIVMYFIRWGSSIVLMTNSIYSAIDTISKYDYAELWSFILFEKGNTPNIPVLMKIIDSWGDDIGFLYGKSLGSWILGFLPSSIRPIDYQPSAMIRIAEWFPHALGNHPPTGVGEMYANFGILGPIIGMFFFGVFCAVLYNALIFFQNYWVLLIYLQIVIGFIFIYPKGEFDNLSLWQILPILVTYALLRLGTGLLRGLTSENKCDCNN